jgi:hypothetical protein
MQVDAAPAGAKPAFDKPVPIPNEPPPGAAVK